MIRLSLQRAPCTKILLTKLPAAQLDKGTKSTQKLFFSGSAIAHIHQQRLVYDPVKFVQLLPTLLQGAGDRHGVQHLVSDGLCCMLDAACGYVLQACVGSRGETLFS